MCCQYPSRGINIFYPLQVKNKPCDRDLKHEFILVTVSYTTQSDLGFFKIKSKYCCALKLKVKCLADNNT